MKSIGDFYYDHTLKDFYNSSYTCIENHTRIKSNLFAVIGANYGDEGKGLVTQRIALQHPGINLNVLYNGGMQRGHTVVYKGTRHVFHSFGSATFTGAITYWGENFIIQPEAVLIECEQLGFIPQVFASNQCRIVTPYDVAFNQFKESLRGDLRHGSCGMGIYETIQRDKVIPLRFADLISPTLVYGLLIHIREYYREKFSQLGGVIPSISVDSFFRGVDFLLKNVKETYDIFNTKWDNIIFEGGQGLALSSSNEDDFPYLTPSKTGSEEIISMIGDSPISIFYVTRPYFTRHGNGPFSTEKISLKDAIKEDKTNIDNEWQGSIRFGLFNIDEILNRIQKDLKLYPKKSKIYSTLFMTQSDDGKAIVDLSEDNNLIYEDISKKLSGKIDRFLYTNNE